MRTDEESLRHQIALGWIASLLILAVTLATMTLQGLFTDADLLALRVDPGYHGLTFLKFTSAVYLLMAIGVYVVAARRRWVRWMFVIVAILLLLLFVLHHLSHWVFGQRPGFISHLMDLQHHVSMGWVVYNSIRWARAPPSGG